MELVAHAGPTLINTARTFRPFHRFFALCRLLADFAPCANTRGMSGLAFQVRGEYWPFGLLTDGILSRR